MSTGTKNYYDVLGVKRSASPDEIKKAFRRLARKRHPDAGGDEESFKELNEAYEVLSDPEKKKEYDLYGQYADQYGRCGNPYAQQGRGPQGAYGYQGQTEFNPFAGYTTENRYDTTAPSGWSEILDSIRNGEGMFGSSWEMPKRAKKGKDLLVELSLSFEEAFNGVTKKVSIRIPSTGQKESLQVKVPQGAVDGGKLRYHGRGEYGTGKSERGDLVITTRILPHDIYRRKGADVIMDLPITIAEAALGTTVQLPAPDGSSFNLKIPAGVQEGRTLRIKDKGAKRIKGDGHGSLDVIVHVVIPTHLNEGQKKALEEFKAAGGGSVRPAIDERTGMRIG